MMLTFLKRILNHLCIVTLVSLCMLNLISSAHAIIITIDAKGTDNMPNGPTEDFDIELDSSDPAANFFHIEFLQGEDSDYIDRIIIDLQAGSSQSGVFDPSDGNPDADANGGGGRGYGPTLGSNTHGLDASDISFTPTLLGNLNNILLIDFAPASFSVGDILSFGIDIDAFGGLGGDNQPAGLLGAQQASFGVQLSAGFAKTVSFQQVNNNWSTATVTDIQTISAPVVWLLWMIGLLGWLSTHRRRHNRV